MKTIPRLALPHLISAAEQEIIRQTAIYEAVGDDWPDGFDPNDIWLYEMALSALRKLEQGQGDQLDLSGKPLGFLLSLLPAYVRTNRQRLSAPEFEVLENLYARGGSSPGDEIAISREAIPDLVIAAETELARLKVLHAPDPADRPPDMGMNDLWLLEVVLKDLQFALERGGAADLRLEGNLGYRLVWCIYHHLHYHQDNLTQRSCQMLGAVRDQIPILRTLFELDISREKSV